MSGGDEHGAGSTSHVLDASVIDAAILDARAMIDARRQDWTDLLQELIRIPSCFETEHAIVHRVCEYVTGLDSLRIWCPWTRSCAAMRMPPSRSVPSRTATTSSCAC